MPKHNYATDTGYSERRERSEPTEVKHDGGGVYEAERIVIAHIDILVFSLA